MDKNRFSLESHVDLSKIQSGVGTTSNALTPGEYEQRIQRCGYDMICRANVVDFLLSSAEGLHDTPAWASLLDDCAKSIESKENFPAVDAVPIVRCRECKYAPSGADGADGFDLEWPKDESGYDDNPCPLKCSDQWYSKKPKPDFFCAYGEKKED